MDGQYLLTLGKPLIKSVTTPSPHRGARAIGTTEEGKNGRELLNRDVINGKRLSLTAIRNLSDSAKFRAIETLIKEDGWEDSAQEITDTVVLVTMGCISKSGRRF